MASRPYNQQGELQGSRHVQLIRGAFNLETDPTTMVGCGVDRARDLVGTGKTGDLVSEVLQKYESYKSDNEHEFTLVYGGRVSEMSTDCDIANALGAPMLLVMNAPGLTPKVIAERVAYAVNDCRKSSAPLVGVIVNQLDERAAGVDAVTARQEVSKRLADLNIPFLGALSRDTVLASQRLDEIVHATRGKYLHDRDRSGQDRASSSVADTAISRVVMATESVEHLLNILRSDEYHSDLDQTAAPLIITSGDRADVMLALLAAQNSRAGPAIAGIVLGGRIPVPRAVLDVYNTSELTLPLIHTYQPMLQVATNILQSPGQIHPTSTRKIAHAIAMVDEGTFFYNFLILSLTLTRALPIIHTLTRILRSGSESYRRGGGKTTKSFVRPAQGLPAPDLLRVRGVSAAHCLTRRRGPTRARGGGGGSPTQISDDYAPREPGEDRFSRHAAQAEH